MSDIELVYSAAQLSTLPHGSVISWLAIVGDPTSEIVGMVDTSEAGHPMLLHTGASSAYGDTDLRLPNFPAQMIRRGGRPE